MAGGILTRVTQAGQTGPARVCVCVQRLTLPRVFTCSVYLGAATAINKAVWRPREPGRAWTEVNECVPRARPWRRGQAAATVSLHGVVLQKVF